MQQLTSILYINESVDIKLNKIDSTSYKVSAIQDGKEIGYAWCYLKGDHIKLELLKVMTASRGMQVGAKIISAVKEFAKTHKQQIHLVSSPLGKDATMTLPQLTAYYEKFGFKVYDTDGSNNYMKL